MTDRSYPAFSQLPLTEKDTSHLASGELPWVEILPGADAKLLRVSETSGTWVILTRFAIGSELPIHRHSGSVVAYTLEGKWGYRENDYLSTAGSFVYEPANSAHTLFCPEDSEEPAIVLFVIEGCLMFYDKDDNFLGILDGKTTLEKCYEQAPDQYKGMVITD